MVSMKVFILIVNMVVPYGYPIQAHTSDPHKYYETAADCDKAGEQWLERARNNMPKNSNFEHNQKASYSCRQQTILVPKG